MSRYNQWLNHKIYQAALQLGNEKIQTSQNAFFDSIIGTLNHIYVADIIWLNRFAQHPINYQALQNLPEIDNLTALDQIASNSIKELSNLRKELDNIIIEWCQEINLDDLESNLQYANTKGVQYSKNLGELIHNFFNHQTHHRGQVSTLIYQQGVDIGVTDLLAVIQDKE